MFTQRSTKEKSSKGKKPTHQLILQWEMREILWPNKCNNKKREIQEVDEGDKKPQELQWNERQLSRDWFLIL